MRWHGVPALTGAPAPEGLDGTPRTTRWAPAAKNMMELGAKDVRDNAATPAQQSVGREGSKLMERQCRGTRTQPHDGRGHEFMQLGKTRRAGGSLTRKDRLAL